MNALMPRHPERQSRDPVEVTLKVSRRDPSVRARHGESSTGLAFFARDDELLHLFANTISFR